MGKGKYRRKQNQRKAQAQRNAQSTFLLDKETNTKTETSNSADSQHDTNSNNSRWMRVWEFFKRSSATDWLLTVFTGVLAVFAITQFIIIRAQLDVMRKDERGWVFPNITVPQQSLQPGQSFRITVSFSNSGKTPVSNVFEKVNVEMVARTDPPTFTYPEPKNTGFIGQALLGFLIPGQPPVEIATSMLEKTFTPKECADFNAGQAYIAIYSRTTYVDAFGIARWVQTCTWPHVPSGEYNARACTYYKGTDNN
jgi:hypothetical protein